MLYTKKGDAGTTKLFHCKQGERVGKDAFVFEVLGSVDELNSSLGFCKALARDAHNTLFVEGREVSYEDIIENVQQSLFSLQAELGGEKFYIKDIHIKYLEGIIAEVEALLPPINSFIVPGGGLSGAYLDVARTIARKSERLLVKHKNMCEKENSVNELSLVFLNRLSSALYALARFANYQEGYTEAKPNYL